MSCVQPRGHLTLMRSRQKLKHTDCVPHTLTNPFVSIYSPSRLHAAARNDRAWLLSAGIDTAICCFQQLVCVCMCVLWPHACGMEASAGNNFSFLFLFFPCALKALASISVTLSEDLCGQPLTSLSRNAISLLHFLFSFVLKNQLRPQQCCSPPPTHLLSVGSPTTTIWANICFTDIWAGALVANFFFFFFFFRRTFIFK